MLSEKQWFDFSKVLRKGNIFSAIDLKYMHEESFKNPCDPILRASNCSVKCGLPLVLLISQTCAPSCV